MRARDLLAVTVLVLALPLSACGGKPDAEADAAAEAADPGAPAADVNVEPVPAETGAAAPVGTEAGTADPD